MDVDTASYHKEDENKSWKAVQDWVQTATWDELSTCWEQQHQQELDYMGRPKGGCRKGSEWTETRKCYWCDLPGHLVRDCPAKKAGKPQKAGLKQLTSRKGGARNGDRAAKSLENDDYEESMLGRDLDGGSLEREGYSVDIDEGVYDTHEGHDYECEDEDLVCGECGDDDCIYCR